jgi:hypothetical protein
MEAILSPVAIIGEEAVKDKRTQEVDAWDYSLSINLTHHDVEASQDCWNVSDQAASAEFVDHAQVGHA